MTDIFSFSFKLKLSSRDGQMINILHGFLHVMDHSFILLITNLLHWNIVKTIFIVKCFFSHYFCSTPWNRSYSKGFESSLKRFQGNSNNPISFVWTKTTPEKTSPPRGWTGCSWIIMWLRSIIHLFLSRKVGFIIVNCVSRMLCTRWLLSHVCFLVSVHRKAVTVWQTVYVTARVPGGTFPSKTSFVKLHIRTFWDWWLSSAPLLNKFRS